MTDAPLHRRSGPVFAALVLGPVLALLRRSSGGILAPMITHITWSTMMLFILPPLFR